MIRRTLQHLAGPSAPYRSLFRDPCREPTPPDQLIVLLATFERLLSVPVLV